MISPASPVADQPRAVASRSASDGAEGGAGRRPAKNADRPRNQSRGCNTVVTHLPGEAKSPSPSPRPELDCVSHRSQQLHRLGVGHRRRMFAQPPPSLAGRCLVHTTVGTSIRLGSGQQPSARRGSPAKMGEHCDRRPGCIPAPPIRPPSMPRLIPAESAHAARPRSQPAKQGLWSPARTGQCHLPAMGSARVRVRQVATWGRRPNAPGESAGGLDLAGVPPVRGAEEKLGMRGWLRAVLLAPC